MVRGGKVGTKGISSAVVLALVSIAVIGLSPIAGEDGGFLIYENFEMYSEGARPPSFHLVEEGSGATEQSVTDDHAYGDSAKSLRLRGTLDLFGSMKVDFTNPMADVGLSARMMAENFTHTQDPDGYDNVNIALGFSTRSSTDYYGCILFSETGNIVFDYGEDQSILMPYEPFRWYECGLYLNYTTKEIAAFIDGTLKISAHLSVDTKSLDCIRMSSGQSGVAGYIDNLGLYAYSISSSTTDGGIDFPLLLIPIITAAIGVPTLLLVMHFKSMAGMPRRTLKIEEIMKAIGLGAPLLSFGLITTLNNRAFGDQFRVVMIAAGICLLIITVIMVTYVISKWKLEVDT